MYTVYKVTPPCVQALENNLSVYLVFKLYDYDKEWLNGPES